MEQRRERVALETDRHHVEGKMTLAREGYRSRLSDHVNRRDHDFFTVVDATVTPLDGSGSWEAPIVMVARHHIRLLVPREESAPS